MLVFDNGDVLLVSECEADHILQLLWSSSGNPTKASFKFINLAFAWKSIECVGTTAKFGEVDLVLGSSVGTTLPLLATIASHVYNGDTMLAENQQKVLRPVFHMFLGTLVHREGTLSNFVKSRGNTHKWRSSFLQELCSRMDLEDCR
ncbi:hypothetical protein PF005_g12397 [Phytophthora fragariae]|nr:hypothetical protein PF009_g14648 [Phytophthora fragariae]KAE8999183.1 hypothetical protein PF011_g14731 [Phytophthora fragariae]KAE9108964.1 hypothetical protein PF010_g11711 [Phytophthora fragariae]KAE9112429.1 hypothetical protein PF007_g11108 [Phytophthora fragariae]KAE9143713.1 hypothetical protein PF006_g11280 [Phytophthora fragariae]